VATQFQFSRVAHFRTVCASDGRLEMLRDQNPVSLLRFDNPKFAVEFADFSDWELLAILASEADKSTLAMPWRVKLHAVNQLGRRRVVPNYGPARAMQTLMAKTQVQRNTQLQEGKDGTVGFTVSDVDPDFDDLDPIKALKEVKQYGRVAEEMDELGVVVEQIRREGGSLKGLVNHYVFTGAPGTGKTSVA
jgi:hypothetical protein